MVGDTHEQTKDCHNRLAIEAVIDMSAEAVAIGSSPYFRAIGEITGGTCD